MVVQPDNAKGALVRMGTYFRLSTGCLPKPLRNRDHLRILFYLTGKVLANTSPLEFLGLRRVQSSNLPESQARLGHTYGTAFWKLELRTVFATKSVM